MSDVMSRADAEVLVRRARVRKEAGDHLLRVDYQRALLAAVSSGMTQRELAAVLKVRQPTVQEALERARAEAGEPVPGRHGATPLEVAERYAVGEIDRATMLAELTSWDYQPMAGVEAGDDLGTYVTGSFDDVVTAVGRGYLAEEDYDAIVSAHRARREVDDVVDFDR